MLKLNKVEKAILIAFVFTVFLLIFADFRSFASVSDSLSHKVLRLHILANSDCVGDQEVKLAIRDAILENSGKIFKNCESLEQTKKIASENLDKIESIANSVLEQRGYSYTANASIVNTFFPTKSYGDVTLPAGNYDAVRITLGQAKGKNWWCVLYPCLCVPAAQDIESSEILSGVLSKNEISLVLTSPKYEPRFAILELWKKLQS